MSKEGNYDIYNSFDIVGWKPVKIVLVKFPNLVHLEDPADTC